MTDVQTPPDALRIQATLDGRWGHVRREPRELLRRPLLHPVAHLEVGRPIQERPHLLIPVGYPVPDATVSDIAEKPDQDVTVWVR